MRQEPRRWDRFKALFRSQFGSYYLGRLASLARKLSKAARSFQMKLVLPGIRSVNSLFVYLAPLGMIGIEFDLLNIAFSVGFFIFFIAFTDYLIKV